MLNSIVKEQFGPRGSAPRQGFWETVPKLISIYSVRISPNRQLLSLQDPVVIVKPSIHSILQERRLRLYSILNPTIELNEKTEKLME